MHKLGRISKDICLKRYLPSLRKDAVRESANKSAASIASGDYVKFRAVIKSAASAASPRGSRASGWLDHSLSCAFFGRTSGQKIPRKSLKYRTLKDAQSHWLFGSGNHPVVQDCENTFQLPPAVRSLARPMFLGATWVLRSIVKQSPRF